MKTISINFLDMQSIKKAERQKSRLENLGYNLVNERQTGLNTFELVYRK